MLSALEKCGNANKAHGYAKEAKKDSDDGQPSPDDYLAAIGTVKKLVAELKNPAQIIEEVAGQSLGFLLPSVDKDMAQVH